MSEWTRGLAFLDVCVVYFALQLMRCVIFSIVLAGVVLLLRRCCLHKMVFAKGMLWPLFLLIPFLGKLKCFYENTCFIKMSWWLTEIAMSHTWIDYIYMIGVVAVFVRIFYRRYRLRKMMAGMEKTNIGGRSIFVTDMRVTPFTTGLGVPKIVIPRTMIDSYSREELETIVWHEQTHIRLGHLWYYRAWDILRCLFWLNPFMNACSRQFYADMEDICDRVCIQNGGKPAYEYGLLLLKSMRLLRIPNEDILSVAAYAGEKNFKDVKRRMEQIADFQAYDKGKVRCAVSLGAAVLLLLLAGIRGISYGRYNMDENIMVYEYDDENGSSRILENSDVWCSVISFDDKEVYVKQEAFEKLLTKNHADHDIYIVFGGFYKLPGFGSGGYSCLYERNCEDALIRIPYEKGENGLMRFLFKIL